MPQPTARSSTTLAAIALGSNLTSSPPGMSGMSGHPRSREANLLLAIERINASLGRVRAVSSFRDTAPVGYLNQPRFLNGALVLETRLDAPSLLHGLLAIERGMGRDRSLSDPSTPGQKPVIAKGPRVIDLDLLLFGQLVLTTPELTVPHPAMWSRRFVLEPLAEIAGTMIDPVSSKTVEQHWRALLKAATPCNPVLSPP